MKKWIPKHLKKDRVHDYILRKYGKKAFTPKGDLKLDYLRKAEKETKNKSLKYAINLAIRFKHMVKK